MSTPHMLLPITHRPEGWQWRCTCGDRGHVHVSFVVVGLPPSPVGRPWRSTTCGSPLWWAAFLLTLFLIGAVSWTWAGEVER